jgi:hypothetical protein
LNPARIIPGTRISLKERSNGMRVLANGKEKFGRRVVHATLFVLALIVLLSFGTPTFAQYKRTDLVSNQGGTAVRDPNLVNAWGITRFPFTPFWVSDNGTGVSTLYDGTGQPQPPPTPLVVTIPSEAGGAGTHGDRRERHRRI